jgi:hypothetical protein
MTPADIQPFIDAAHPHLVMARGIPLKAFQMVCHDQRIAMYTYKPVSKFRLKFT